MSTLGERLRKARKRKGLSQMDVFDALGISNKSLSRYEKDTSAPSPEVLKKLSRLYDVSSEYILGVTAAMGQSSDNVSDGDNLIDMLDQRGSAEKLIRFISSSPTAFHTAENIAQKLINEGFTRLNEWDEWDIQPGGKYFTVRNGSSVIAFKIGSADISGANIYIAHGDSPMFKLKPDAEMETLGRYIRLNTERYGGAILSTWFDRPLSIAGRVAVNSPDGVRSVLVNLTDANVIIPSVAIHFNRTVNDGLHINPQIDTLPILGSISAKGSLLKKTALAAGVKEREILGTELFVYNRTEGMIWGVDGEYVSSPRLDNMQCTYAGLQGFVNGDSERRISLYCVFDNEEVGSSTKQGANSDLLRSVFMRICRALSIDPEITVSKSFCVSADNAHALHPNHPEYADPINQPTMNRGPVIKTAARQSYATDSQTEAIFKKICASVGVPYQSFANRSDLPGGGTVGNISATRVSAPTVDIGLAQLSMHSSYETAGSMDTIHLERAIAEFFRTEIIPTDGGYKVGE